MSLLRIPDDWSGEEALIIVAFLEDVAQAIWSRYQWEMGLIMERRYNDNNPDSPISTSEEAPDLSDDAMPF